MELSSRLHNSSIQDCCKNIDNLEIKDSGKKDLELRVCKICNRRHFELNLDAGKFELELK